MKASIASFHTDIFLTNEEVFEHCTPGKGADTCSWLISSNSGFQCTYYHKPSSIVKRRKENNMVAMRDGCEKVKNFNTVGKGIGVVEF